MRKPHVIIPANKNLKINSYLAMAFYILILLMLEPIIDYLLLFDVNKSNLILINEISEKKKILIHSGYGVLRMLPMIMLVWFGYRVLSSAHLPPARMSLPFSVIELKGRKAKVAGIFIISLALLFMAQNIAFMANQLI